MIDSQDPRRSVMFASLIGRPRLTRFLDGCLVLLIVLNVLATILESVAGIAHRHGRVLHAFEWFSVAVFSVEYSTRLWLAPKHPTGRYRAPVAGRLRFALTPLVLVDLAAILPFYLSFLTGLDLRFLRTLRLFRIFKLTRYSASMSILLSVLREEARSFAAALFVLTVILILAASGMYLVERQAQPEEFGSIPAAMWWAVATLTTVGYGDVTPVTAMGKVFGSLVTVVGVGMVALPAGILSSAFSDHLRRRRETLRREMEHALEDGSLTLQERNDLEGRRSELGIPDEEAARLLESASHEGSTEENCPRCGRAWPQSDPLH